MPGRAEDIADRIDCRLRAAGNAERAFQERRCLKSSLAHYGASVPEIRRIARAASKDEGGLERERLLAAVEALWSRPVHEPRVAAVELLRFGADRLDAADLTLVERLLREANTWALVDALAPGVAAPLVERYAHLGATLDRWAADASFWLRRSALLALLPALARGGGDFERFSRYADSMLDERELFVRKAIGWVLRETARKRPRLIYEWLLPRAARASGVTVYEAVRWLSEAEREAILSRHPTLGNSKRARVNHAPSGRISRSRRAPGSA